MAKPFAAAGVAAAVELTFMQPLDVVPRAFSCSYKLQCYCIFAAAPQLCEVKTRLQLQGAVASGDRFRGTFAALQSPAKGCWHASRVASFAMVFSEH